jgi:short-subunit dehydrogenase
MKYKNPSVLQNCKNAVITGASSGIGLEFAKQLAARKINLILIARRKERLDEICKELSNTYNISAKAIPADLANFDEIQKVIQEILKISPIDILINCAGFATLGYFASVPLEAYSEMISLHINAAVALCYFLLPKMQEQNQGIIINIASIGAFTPIRGNSVYSATKSFLITFSENINLELERTNIIVQVLCPGYTKTEFHHVRDFSSFDSSVIPEKLWMSVSDVVAISLAKLKKNKIIVIPGLKNRLLVKFYNSFIIQSFIKYKRKKVLNEKKKKK